MTQAEIVAQLTVDDLVSNVQSAGAKLLAVTDCIAMGEDNEDVLLRRKDVHGIES